MDRLNQFKKKRYEFGSVEARIVRACKIEKRRKQQRAEDIARSRFATIVDENYPKDIALSGEVKSNDTQVNNRVTQLLKWKAEKELKKKIESLTKKPPFVVGIPHPKPWSATINRTQVFDCQHHKSNKTKLIASTRITRATAKRLAEKEKIINLDTLLKCKSETIKKEKKKSNEEPNSIFPSTEHYAFHVPKGIVPVRMLNIKSLSTDKQQNPTNDNIKSSSVFNSNTKIQAKINMNSDDDMNNIDKKNQNNMSSKSYSNVKLVEEENGNQKMIQHNSSPNENCINTLFQSSVPAALSPFITSKRGKSNIRDEQKELLGLNNLRNIIPTKDNISEIINISANESPKTAQYYKYLLHQETDRLHNLCENWKKIQENSETTDDGRYIINQAIGQTALLINKKFKRFDGLVSDCIKGNKELLVTCRDLQGFWDMMSMEIKDCHSRFEKLEKLQANSWIEENPDVSEKIIKTKKKSMRKNKICGRSNMRAFIEATRKQRINDQKIDFESDYIMLSENRRYHTRASAEKRNSIKTPLSTLDNSISYTNLPQTPGKGILKHNNGVEKRKSIKTPLSKLDNSISYTNLPQTPGKGILKHNNETKKFYDELNKSAVKVNFDKVFIYNSTSPHKMVKNTNNRAYQNTITTHNFDKSTNMNGSILKESDFYPNARDTSELKSRNTNSSKLSLRKKTLKNRKSHSICENTPPARILRSHSQIEHNNVINNTPGKINNLKEKELQSVLPRSDKLNSKLAGNIFKGNDYTSTPHQRRSTRKSTKLNYSGECTACTSITKMKPDELNC